MTENLAADRDATDARSHPSRRTVVRSAAMAAWTVPAVTLATAAPAFAASASLTASVTASYHTFTDGASSAPGGKQVDFSGVVNNAGPRPALGTTLTLRVPSTTFTNPALQHTTAPTFSALAGWTGPTSVTNSGGAWVATYVFIGNLPTGTTNYSGTITFNNTASPFAAWSGHSFTLGGTISATNQTSAVFTPGNVAAAPSALTKSLVLADFRRSTTGGYTTRFVSASAISNGGFSTVGPITAKVYMRKTTVTGSQGGWATNQPTLAANHGSWSLVSSNSSEPSPPAAGDDAPLAGDCWTWTFVSNQGYPPAASKTGPGSAAGPPNENVTATSQGIPSPNPGNKPFWARFTRNGGTTPGSHTCRMYVRFTAQSAGATLDVGDQASITGSNNIAG